MGCESGENLWDKSLAAKIVGDGSDPIFATAHHIGLQGH
jgi:hypothetical protein